MHMKTEFTEFFPGFRCFILTQNCVLYGNSKKFHKFLYLIILKKNTGAADFKSVLLRSLSICG